MRAVCGVANPRNSTAIAAVSRLASHPAKSLSRREEIMNTLLTLERLFQHMQLLVQLGIGLALACDLAYRVQHRGVVAAAE